MLGICLVSSKITKFIDVNLFQMFLFSSKSLGSKGIFPFSFLISVVFAVFILASFYKEIASFAKNQTSSFWILKIVVCVTPLTTNEPPLPVWLAF